MGLGLAPSLPHFLSSILAVLFQLMSSLCLPLPGPFPQLVPSICSPLSASKLPGLPGSLLLTIVPSLQCPNLVLHTLSSPSTCMQPCHLSRQSVSQAESTTGPTQALRAPPSTASYVALQGLHPHCLQPDSTKDVSSAGLSWSRSHSSNRTSAVHQCSGHSQGLWCEKCKLTPVVPPSLLTACRTLPAIPDTNATWTHYCKMPVHNHIEHPGASFVTLGQWQQVISVSVQFRRFFFHLLYK